jgi:redox-sensitive bicupin YhaK (pirin superfamily)
VVSGNLAHKDSMGNVKGIPPGDVQRMSAGTGVQHSEFNHAEGETTHFFQIWLEPSQKGIAPGYEQKTFSAAEKQGVLRLLASPDAAEGSVRLHADARLYSGLFEDGQTASLELPAGRLAYVHLMRGQLQVNGQTLSAGDAALLEGERRIDVSQGEGAEVLVFDLAP